MSQVGDSEDIPGGRDSVRVVRPRGYFNQRLGLAGVLTGERPLS